MIRSFFFYLCLIPLTGFSQYKITGRVINAADQSAVSKASVFLSNATIGNSSNDEGGFILYNVRPGQYELVVSIIGFETYREMVMMTNADISLNTIKLTPRTIELNEVSITPDRDWVTKYELFKKEFLGPSAFAAKCKILNPEALTLEFSAGKTILTASSYDFLEIENHELGYKIKYLLNKFLRNGKTGLVYYEGSPLFEHMKGKPSQLQRWKKNRMKAYMGSSMHFLRAVISNRLKEESFEVRRLIRQNDSTKKSMFANVQMLVKTPLTIFDFTKRTDQQGIYALEFNNHLYVMYTKKSDRGQLRPAYKPAEAPDYATSIIGFEEQYAFFDSNGVILNPAGIVFEGTWAGQRLAELLPVNYEPTE